MIDYGTLETGLLEPTTKYGTRAWGWHHAVPGTGDGLGLLSIEVTNGSRRETTRYVVEELDPLPGLMGRQFKLTKTHTDTSYTVVIGGLPSCTCQAGQCRLPCKHLDAVAAIAAKVLAEPNQLTGGTPCLAI